MSFLVENVKGVRGSMMKPSDNNRLTITSFVHQIIRDRVAKGATVVDATMGNGKDTYFLYDLIGSSGRLYAFDIQKTSIDNTTRLFSEAGIELSKNIQLIHDGHENLARHIKDPIDCGVFNLGYLPGGNHEIVTKPNTTLIAIKAMLDLLKVGGIVTVTIYYGHKGGREEKESLLAYLEGLPFEYFNVMKWYTINNKNNPPIVAVIEKK